MDKYEQLAEYLEARQTKPFEWGKTDCAMLAADWLMIRYENDLAQAFRGRYKTRIGAARALTKLGFSSLEDAFTAALGAPRAQALLTQRGDIASVDTDQGLAVGIVTSRGILLQGEFGLVAVPITSVICAWEVK